MCDHFSGFRHSSIVAAMGSDKNASSVSSPTVSDQPGPNTASVITQQQPAPPVVRITLASMEECNVLLHNGLDFYGATFFPVEAASPVVPPKKKPLAPNRYRSPPRARASPPAPPISRPFYVPLSL